MLIRRLVTGGSRLVTRHYYTVNSELATKQTDVIAKHLHGHIKIGGPITVAEYMRQVLTHPMGGYYMHKDMFGEGGDFVTSPELGQIFGEMIAVWLLNEWSKVGSPKPVQVSLAKSHAIFLVCVFIDIKVIYVHGLNNLILKQYLEIVELGPGRGTLCQDVLRVFEHFEALKQASVHLVEVSPLLSDLQARRLCVKSNTLSDKDSPFYREGVGFQGVPIRWYRTLADVPKAFTLLVAHEFFDALPVHKFQNTDSGYREVLIDIDPQKTDPTFRYVMAREPTPMSKLLVSKEERREHLEVCPEGLLTAKDIAKRLEEDGGMALIADYGHNGDGTDTFRAFKKHALHDPLVEPGTADLTADVDFAALKKAATEDGGVLAFGPVPQRDFLLRMGIEHRVKRLEEFIDAEQAKLVRSGFHTMTDEDKMGARFKFLALLPSVLESVLKKVPVVGFG